MNATRLSLVQPTTWLTAGEVTARYAVGERTLAAHSFHGNLSLRRDPDGTVRFDERAVASLFRPRQGEPAGLGVLGAARLGDPLPDPDAAPMSSRGTRRSSARIAQLDWTFAGGERRAR